LHDIDRTSPETPRWLNLFMNIAWTEDGTLSFEPPFSAPGSYIRLRAEMDLVIAFSADSADQRHGWETHRGAFPDRSSSPSGVI